MPNGLTRLCLAFDTPELSGFWKELESFNGLNIVAKIGLRLLPQMSPQDFKKLQERNVEFFIDAKLFDIPTQVEDTVKSWAQLGASFLTLHLSGGSKMLESSARAAENTKLTLLGVSVLTSFDDQDLKAVGVNKNCSEQVMDLVRLGYKNSITSYVSSVAEVSLIKKEMPKAFCVCPGIKLEGESPHLDQKRSYTPGQAMQAGVDMIVVGRSVLKAPNPRSVAENIIRSLCEG